MGSMLPLYAFFFRSTVASAPTASSAPSIRRACASVAPDPAAVNSPKTRATWPRIIPRCALGRFSATSICGPAQGSRAAA